MGELTQELNCGREELELAALENAKLREERNQMKEVIDHLEARVQTADEKLTQVYLDIYNFITY